ncbi:MAG TPA: FAD/NAD(P)-binding oxidoreductase, partial [Propionibacteriaceae bacterium]|nr:FAD/NAD(P)-binding oxidoreductase [Propionibacteriaceae bacterium]
AVIIGAGWIGLETASAARTAGLEVTLLVSGDLPLQHVLGPEVAPIFAELHRGHGVDPRYRARATGLTGRHGRVTGVVLSDGTRIDADMIIVGIGAVPRTEIATDAGLKIDNGIVVDQHLRTSDPDIFAAGDIARTYNPRLGQHIRVEHWANARRQGVVAARAMLGQDAADVRPSYFFTDQYDFSMEYTGDIGPTGYDRVIFRRHAESNQMIVFWLHQQRVQAGMNINIWDVADDIERLVQSAHPVNPEDLANPAIPLGSLG